MQVLPEGSLCLRQQLSLRSCQANGRPGRQGDTNVSATVRGSLLPAVGIKCNSTRLHMLPIGTALGSTKIQAGNNFYNTCSHSVLGDNLSPQNICAIQYLIIINNVKVNSIYRVYCFIRPKKKQLLMSGPVILPSLSVSSKGQGGGVESPDSTHTMPSGVSIHNMCRIMYAKCTPYVTKLRCI